VKENERIEENIKHLKSLNDPCVVPIIGWEGPPDGIGPVTWTGYQANDSPEGIMKNVEMHRNVRVLTHTRRTIMTIGLVVRMNYVHRNGVIHGSMKPSDVLIDDNHRRRVNDFAMMRMDKLKAIKASQVCSPCYVAPEVYGDGYVESEKANIFALGVILYGLLMCRKLFAADQSPASVMREIMMGIKREFSVGIHKNIVR
jgi:serine/threonine protein kinase